MANPHGPRSYFFGCNWRELGGRATESSSLCSAALVSPSSTGSQCLLLVEGS